MKRLIYIFALCAFAASCSKQIPVMESENRLPEKVNLTVGLPQTKSTAGQIANDNVAYDLQVFIFNVSDGTLDSYASNDTGKALTLSCTTGQKNIYALVNYTKLSSVISESELLSQTIGYASINPSRMFMCGEKKNVQITANTGNIAIDVYKKVARIKLKSVTNAITIPQFRDAEFKIEKVYLLNIPSEMPLMTRPDQSSYTISWENLGQEHLRDNICWHGFNDRDLPSENGLLASGSSYTDGLYFYSFENWSKVDCTPESSDTDPRFTRLVIVASIGGEYYNYPVSLPDLQPGKTYEVSLTVTRPGSKDPDQGISKEEAGVSIVVKDWTTGKSYTETI